jgi:hypothetical protein
MSLQHDMSLHEFPQSSVPVPQHVEHIVAVQPHLFGVPPPPHVSGMLQPPQLRLPPQPSG